MKTKSSFLAVQTFQPEALFPPVPVASLALAIRPHYSTYTRACSHTPISRATTVAHCYFGEKKAGVKTWWMEKTNLWSVQEDP